MNGRDGNTAMFSLVHGETFNCPAEIAEARYGVYVDQVTLNSEPGGEGEWRGGKGILVDYRIRADDIFLTLGYTRSRILPWGVSGGVDGSPNYVEVIRASGGCDRYAVATGVIVNEGDIVRIHTGNGAGYGDPRNRDKDAVRSDIQNGYVTPERAQEIYGI
jgi:N-methylhydantoinase B